MISKLDFSEALRHVKSGAKIARAGWNGKAMFVVYQKAYPEGKPKFGPCLMIRMADGNFTPWLITQPDALAEDWIVL